MIRAPRLKLKYRQTGRTSRDCLLSKPMRNGKYPNRQAGHARKPFFLTRNTLEQITFRIQTLRLCDSTCETLWLASDR